MKIEQNRLIIDTPMSEMEVEELAASLRQEQVEEVIIQNDDLHASIIQVLWCFKESKTLKVESEFLDPFFEHVVKRQES